MLNRVTTVKVRTGFQDWGEQFMPNYYRPTCTNFGTAHENTEAPTNYQQVRHALNLTNPILTIP